MTGKRGSTYRWRRQRKLALERDGYRCLNCGSPERLEVDHVDGDPHNDELDNLQTLCQDCHHVKHGRTK